MVVICLFKINVLNLEWINGCYDDPTDLCAHGHAVAWIGEEKYEYDATVSSTALYLLKSLTEDHIIYQSNQMLPCCGFNIYARDKSLDTVDIMGCPNGIDWSIIHEHNKVKLITQTGKKELVDLNEYKEAVFKFADKVESFYNRCQKKELPQNELDKEGYIAFWNEWHRRRGLNY